MEPRFDALSDIQHKLRLRSMKPGVLNEKDFELIYQFAKELTQKFSGFVHGIILFGSRAREKSEEGSDIDLLILVDDVVTPVTQEIISAYRLGVGEILAKLNATDRIHVTTLGISDWFDAVRHADPVAVNVLRDGKAIVDTGFFEPLKRLLMLGRIRPSKEAIDAHLNRAKALLNATNIHLLAAIDDLYWACIDAADALLMHLDIPVPSPKDIVEVFKNELPKKIKVDDEHIQTLDEIIKVMKSIAKREKTTATAEELEKYKEKVRKFIEFVENSMKS